MSQRKIIALIIITVLVGTIIGFFYLVLSNQEASRSLQGDSKDYEESSSQNQSSRDDREVLNWQIYHNKELRFSFKHPNDLIPETNISAVTGRPYKTSYNWVSVIYLTKRDETHLLQVYVYEGPITSAIRAKESLVATTKSPHKILEVVDETVGGRSAKEVTWVNSALSSILKKEIFIQTPHNNTLIFTVNVGDPSEERIFEKILSTIMFSGD